MRRLATIAAVLLIAAGVLAGPGAAAEGDKLKTARSQIEAKQYRAALLTLDQISPCDVRCRYAKAVAHAQLFDRANTQVLAAGLVTDPAASPALRAGAAKLLAWSQDQRVRQETGRRTVRRRMGAGYTLSEPTCRAPDPLTVKATTAEWKALGVDPSTIYVPELYRTCDIGSPVVEKETYYERCDKPAREAVEAAQAKEPAAGEEEDDGLDGYEWGDPRALQPRPGKVVLEAKTAVLDCAAFAPPALAELPGADDAM